MKKSHTYLTIAASVIAISSTPALAQQAPADDDKKSEGVNEIVVTAQRRAENLQDVNIAATAVSGDDLTSKGSRAAA